MQRRSLALGMLVATVIVAGPAYGQIPPEPPGQSTPDRSFETTAPSSILVSLGNYVGAPVIDNTGLTGEWDVDLKFELDASSAPGGTEPRYGSIFTAVREQLGLKLEPTKSDVQVLVIEHLERPSPN